MGKIIAIGGGEIGRPGTKIETTTIDKEILKLSGRKNPSLLFIPTASNDSESYYNVVKKHFNDNLKCKTDVLYLIKNLYLLIFVYSNIRIILKCIILHKLTEHLFYVN